MAIIYSYPIATPQGTDLLIISRTPTVTGEISNYSVDMSSVADYVIDKAFNGTDRYIPRFDGTSSLVNSVIYQDTDGHVGVGVVGSPPNPVHKFEVFDLRNENTSSDYSSVVTTHVNAPFTGGGGGILSRLSVDSGATYVGQISLVPGTNSNDVMSNTKLAIYANSNMDTSSASNLAGTVTHDGTNAHWILGGSFGDTTTATLKVNGSLHVEAATGTNNPNDFVQIVGDVGAKTSLSLLSGDNALSVKPNSGTDTKFTVNRDSGTDIILQASNTAGTVANDIKINPFGGDLFVGQKPAAETFSNGGSIKFDVGDYGGTSRIVTLQSKASSEDGGGFQFKSNNLTLFEILPDDNGNVTYNFGSADSFTVNAQSNLTLTGDNSVTISSNSDETFLLKESGTTFLQTNVNQFSNDGIP